MSSEHESEPESTSESGDDRRRGESSGKQRGRTSDSSSADATDTSPGQTSEVSSSDVSSSETSDVSQRDTSDVSSGETTTTNGSSVDGPGGDTTDTGTGRQSVDGPGDDIDYPVTAVPTVRPTLVWLAVVLLGGGILTALVVGNPGVFGGSDQANVVGNAVLLLTAIGVVRFLIRVYVLRQTEYVVDERSLIRRYTLLLRTWRREVPLSMVRSHQLEQGRIQKLLGYGTIAVNQGLGDLRFENVREPTELNEVIAEQVSQAAGRGHGSSS